MCMQIEVAFNLQYITLTDFPKEHIYVFFSSPLFYPTSLGKRLAHRKLRVVLNHHLPFFEYITIYQKLFFQILTSKRIKK